MPRMLSNSEISTELFESRLVSWLLAPPALAGSLPEPDGPTRRTPGDICRVL